jgi:hypothetical protein
MDRGLSGAALERSPAGRSLWQRVVAVCSLVRYRFFLYAGLLPYLLGAAWAYAMVGRFDATLFFSGLAGVVLAVVGVEAFNEYFDSRMGTDRVFNLAELPPMSDAVLWFGAAVRRCALRSASTSLRGGWPILAFALLGGARRSSTSHRRSAGPIAASASSSSRFRTGRGWCSAASTSTPAPYRGRRWSCRSYQVA